MVSYGTPSWLLMMEQKQYDCNDDAQTMIDWLLTDAIKYGMAPDVALAKAKQYGYVVEEEPKAPLTPPKRGRKPKQETVQ